MQVTLGINEDKVIVSGHLKMFPEIGFPIEVFSSDLKTLLIQTSSIADVRISENSNNLIIRTQNSIYNLYM
jgi:hypothetical protein